MNTKALMNTLADKLAQVQAETLGETLANVKAEELVHALGDTVAENTVLTHEKTLGDMNAKTLVDADCSLLRRSY